MRNNISLEYIDKAVDEVVASLGVKESPSFCELSRLLDAGRIQDCANIVAKHLGLPILVDVSIILSDYATVYSPQFHSTDLVHTTIGDQGSGEIVAQVCIPSDLPSFGEPRLIGFPIHVAVRCNYTQEKHTFITLLVHELSHILLNVINHAHKDDEFYTDVAAIALGFGRIMQKGRKGTSTDFTGNQMQTITTTYGYLSDSQFRFTLRKINALINERRQVRVGINDLSKDLRGRCKTADRQLRRFRTYLERLDTLPSKRMRADEGTMLVEFHNHDYTTPLEDAVAECKRVMLSVVRSTEQSIHYTGHTMKMLSVYTNDLNRLSANLDRLMQALDEDIKLLRRHTGLAFRVLTTLKAMASLDR